MTESENPDSRTELIVYWCYSVERGPEHRLFDEDDIQAAGGINGVEMELQRESYWFVRLGVIEAQKGASGWFFPNEAIASLAEPDQEWSLGRHNPAFRRGAFERHIFECLFRSLLALLKSWAHDEEGAISAYVIKQIDMSPTRLSSIASALISIRQAYEVAEMTVIKYWYGPEWRATCVPCDLVLAEFPLSIPVRFRLDGDQVAIAIDFLSSSWC